MSDRPLFQDSDDREATFAPEQLPSGTEQAAVDEGTPNRESGLPAPTLPLAATGAAVSAAGAGNTGGTAGTVSGAVPAIGAIALADEVEKNDAAERRD